MIDVRHQISTVERRVGRRTARRRPGPGGDDQPELPRPGRGRVGRLHQPGPAAPLVPAGHRGAPGRAVATSWRATPRAPSSAATRRTSSPRPGSTAARSAGSRSGSPLRASEPGSSWSTSRTSTTSAGPSSVRVPSGSAGTSASGDSPSTWSPARTSNRRQQWAATPDGVWFMTESSEAWSAAAVAAGDDPAAARAAADRTTAVYTGHPADPAPGHRGRRVAPGSPSGHPAAVRRAAP